MWRACAISHGVTSMSRDAAAEHRQRSRVAVRDALALLAVLLEAQVEDFRAGHRRADRGVGVQADEEIRLVVVGEAARSSSATLLIAVAREDHADAEPRLERPLQPPGHAQRDGLLERPARPARAVVFAAVAGVDRRSSAVHPAGARSSERRQFGRGVRGVGVCGVAGCCAGSVVCAATSMTGCGRRRDRREVGSAERREPRTEIDDQRSRTVAGADALNEVRDTVDGGSVASSASASNRTTSRVPSWATACGVAGADVQRQAGRARRATRAGRRSAASRTSPARSAATASGARCGYPMASASARETKSTGTNHARPSRTGAARSEIEPAADRGQRLSGAEHDRLAAVATVRPPAATPREP